MCLSILGTWRGLPGEECTPTDFAKVLTRRRDAGRSSQGFQSVLISILSLMNSDPVSLAPFQNKI